eukprot:m.10852 g.10852  ORF g.10852 m.10852 type:complete len:262 (-) comp8516_c0_seq1:191-976(-)
MMTLLSNVHLELPGLDHTNGLVETVQGHYDYYHYCVDGFNDVGWGCAYRTCQTMLSHLKYTSKMRKVLTPPDIPSIRQMQQLLCSLGDKSSLFVGSSTWIGSCEIALLVNALYGVPCRILTTNDGQQAGIEWGKDLLDHFRTEKTPVMCGGAAGGSVAILGIDLTVPTSPKVLLLDPHYSGPDILEEVFSTDRARWCYWCDATLYFEKNAFYNCCLPLVSRATSSEIVVTQSDYTIPLTMTADTDTSNDFHGIEVVAAGFD